MDGAMATAQRAAAYPHLERTPGVRGGRACIAGTRSAVVDVALAHGQGLKPEEITTDTDCLAIARSPPSRSWSPPGIPVKASSAWS